MRVSANPLRSGDSPEARTAHTLNNAGIMSIAQLSLLKVDEWDHMIDLSINGVLYGVADILP